jgi:hypothetical protein
MAGANKKNSPKFKKRESQRQANARITAAKKPQRPRG